MRKMDREYKKDILVGVIYGIIGILNIIIFSVQLFDFYIRVSIHILSFFLGFVAFYFLGKRLKRGSQK